MVFRALLCALLLGGTLAWGAPTFNLVRAASEGPWGEPGAGGVAVYDKFELVIDLDAQFENPFDPEQIDVWAEFTAPSGRTLRVWGFYKPTNWAAEWMVRFAPIEEGEWTYVVKARDRSGETASQPGSLRATLARSRGFVTIGDNKRYFRTSDGAGYYPVGLWFNDDYDSREGGQITRAELRRLRRQGVNFIGFFPTPLETLGTGLGRYDQGRADRLDEVFRWCEELEIGVSWNLVFHSYISQAVWGGGNARYRNSPYRGVAEAEDWFKSDAAWRNQQQLNRYIVARWGYSRALALWFVIDEINGTEGWIDGGAESAEAWCRKMNQFFHQNDPYGRPTTGTQSGSISNWWPAGYKIFDVAAREIYEAQGFPMPPGGKPDLMGNHPLRASYKNYAQQVQDLWRGFGKPSIIGECGWEHTYYEFGTPGYLAMRHNAQWAALANGAAATPLWWSHTTWANVPMLGGDVQALARFVSDIDFTAEFAPLNVEVTTGDAYAMRGGDLVFGWMASPSSGVANETVTLRGLSAKPADVLLYRTWKGRYLEPQEVTYKEGVLNFTVPELAPSDNLANNVGDDIAFKISMKTKLPRLGRP